MSISEDAEAERVARFLDGEADDANELRRKARAEGNADLAEQEWHRMRLARTWARQVRERRHRDQRGE